MGNDHGARRSVLYVEPLTHAAHAVLESGPALSRAWWRPDGGPVDEATDPTDGPADAVRNLNETRSIVATFLLGDDRCDYTAGGDHTLIVDADGGEVPFEVTAEESCGWDVTPFGNFMAPTRTRVAGAEELSVQVEASCHYALAGDSSVRAGSDGPSSTLSTFRNARYQPSLFRVADTSRRVRQRIESGTSDFSISGLGPRSVRLDS